MLFRSGTTDCTTSNVRTGAAAGKPGVNNALGGGGGGGANGDGTGTCSGGTGGAPGAGGGSSESATAGFDQTGGAGQIKLTETHGKVGIALEEDNGSFGSWTFVKQIVYDAATSSSVRARSAAFTPTSGRNYRIVASTTNASATYDIYNAKIIVEQGNWAQVGNSLAIATVNGPALASLNSTDAAFIDSLNDSLRTYRFNGTDWAQVGNSLAVASAGIPALASLNSTDVAFIDDLNDSLRTYRFNGTDWAQVGNSLAIATVGGPALASLNSTEIGRAHV